MENLEINAQTRTTTGNGPARALRRDKKVPAVVYGPRTESRMLYVEAQQLEAIQKKGSMGRSVYHLRIDADQAATPVMIKELQTHPVSGEFLHVDFYEVAMDQKIRVFVPIHTTGKSIGVEKGGMLQLVRRDLEISCLPNEIPDGITIDITNLEIGDSVHVGDIEVQGNTEIPHDVNFTILAIAATKKETEAGGEEEEGEEGGAVEEAGAD